MDVLMIVFICLISILLIIANIYLLAYYCHPDDRGFGSTLICKIVVVILFINHQLGIRINTCMGSSSNAAFRCCQYDWIRGRN